MAGIRGKAETKSPISNLFTFEPVLITLPTNSWPITSGYLYAIDWKALGISEAQTPE